MSQIKTAKDINAAFRNAVKRKQVSLRKATNAQMNEFLRSRGEKLPEQEPEGEKTRALSPDEVLEILRLEAEEGMNYFDARAKVLGIAQKKRKSMNNYIRSQAGKGTTDEN